MANEAVKEVGQILAEGISPLGGQRVDLRKGVG